MSTLYRKYRPQTWEEVVGQNHIKITLQREIETGKLAHAFLFSGPRGIGKTTLARLLAKAINCEKRKADASEPCNQCASCQEIAESRSIDVLEIDAASHTGVDNVRENIIESSRFLPVKNKYKVFIIDEAHMLSPGAFNALLKTLEEPPAHVIFVLATTELAKLPETIVSRCQRFDFKKINADDIVKRLKNIAGEEKIKIDKKVLEQVAYRSEGCLRDAESLLGQIFSLGAKEITEEEAGLVLPRSDFNKANELFILMAQKNLKEALLFLNNLAEEGLDLVKFSDDLIEFGRFLLLSKLGGDLGRITFVLEENLLKSINKLNKEFEASGLLKIIDIFLKQKGLLRSSPVPQLPLEMALVMICGAGDVGTAPNPPNVSHPAPRPSIKKLATENPPLIKKTSEELSTEKSEISQPIDSGEMSVSLDIIRAKWQDILKKVQDYNHSLSFIMRMSEPIEVEQQIVRVGVKFGFHRDKLNEPKLRILAEKALAEVLGCSVILEAVLCLEGVTPVGELPPPARGGVARSAGVVGVGAEADNLANSLAQAFGGKVIN